MNPPKFATIEGPEIETTVWLIDVTNRDNNRVSISFDFIGCFKSTNLFE